MSQPTPQQLRVKPGRQFPFLARHPWVHAHALISDGNRFSDGGNLDRGDIVELVDRDGNFLGRGLVNPHSRLRVRLYTYESTTPINDALWTERIDAAIGRRRLSRVAEQDEAERLIFSESDLISGLIVDRYADCLGVQFTAGA